MASTSSARTPLRRRHGWGSLQQQRLHCAQELRPGAAQKVWVQSQTTFAALARDEEGRWCARVLKQKIWVEGVSYELQEIYGMENSGPAPQQPEKEVGCRALPQITKIGILPSAQKGRAVGHTARVVLSCTSAFRACVPPRTFVSAAWHACALKQGAALMEENEERLCVICLVNERDTTVLPCRCALLPCSHSKTPSLCGWLLGLRGLCLLAVQQTLLGLARMRVHKRWVS
jgi:hypothetical protein